MARGFSITLKVETDGDREAAIVQFVKNLPVPAEVTTLTRWSDVPGPSDACVDDEGMAMRIREHRGEF